MQYLRTELVTIFPCFTASQATYRLPWGIVARCVRFGNRVQNFANIVR